MKINIDTDKGTMTATLYDAATPKTVENFVNLIKKDFYKDLTFHRVIPEFMVQGGCPNGDGRGGPGYTIDCEIDSDQQYHDKGVLSMAHAGRNTGGSQFFICHNRHNTQHLDGNHTCFGKVDGGLDILDQIKGGDKFTIKLVE
jgi:peptidyl-prolyl cis-trans isomerase B (cyclophilin B)|tara:strand:- start:777 stop:1205 length:429 start_codon:yes stop_codon:yes gene_type:complete